jgi:hypothetical protein
MAELQHVYANAMRKEGGPSHEKDAKELEFAKQTKSKNGSSPSLERLRLRLWVEVVKRRRVPHLGGRRDRVGDSGNREKREENHEGEDEGRLARHG